MAYEKMVVEKDSDRKILSNLVEEMGNNYSPSKTVTVKQLCVDESVAVEDKSSKALKKISLKVKRIDFSS